MGTNIQTMILIMIITMLIFSFNISVLNSSVDFKTNWEAIDTNTGKSKIIEDDYERIYIEDTDGEVLYETIKIR